MEAESPFGPRDDTRVPGELLIKLSAEGNMSVSESIPSGPVRRVAAMLPSRLGIASLDEALKDLGVASISKVHSPVSGLTMAASGVGVHAIGMSATYRLWFTDPETDLSAAAQRLGRFKAVAEVSPNYFRWSSVVPNDAMYGQQWGIAKINCPAAWDRTRGSASVIVAVVDTGVDLDHPDLASQLLAGYDAVDLVGAAPQSGWHFEGDYLTRDNDPQDEVGHGTHVAGTIAAITNNAVGVAGVTWYCRILPVKVLARMVKNDLTRVTGVGSAADIAHGIRWAADHGAHIINLSLGGYTDTFVERDAIAYAASKGVLVVAAMGNDDTGIPSYPAAYPDVVAVGAIDQTENRAFFSNYGSHIDLVAPGVNIRSTCWNNAYDDKDGTSMASPHVAGVAALLKSCKESLTAAEIADILRKTAKPLRDKLTDPVPNDYYGYGLVDAQAAVQRACPVQPPSCKPYAGRPYYCLPYGARPTLCMPYASRPIICPPYATRPAFCMPYAGRPVVVPLEGAPEGEAMPSEAAPAEAVPPEASQPIMCSPYTGLPTIPCSPYTGQPVPICPPYTSRPVLVCSPYTGRPVSFCSSYTARPTILCPGGGPRPIGLCPTSGGRPVVEPPIGPIPPVEPPVEPIPPVGPPQPYSYGWGYEPFAPYGGGGYAPYQAWGQAPYFGYGAYGEYDPWAEYEYAVWLGAHWCGFDPWFG